MKKQFIIAVCLLFSLGAQAQVITTTAGNGTGGYLGDGSPATAAQLYEPSGIAFDHSGNLLIADFANDVVRKVTPAGIISTVAGNNITGYSADGIAATSSQLNRPADVAVDALGNIYIADEHNNRIRKVSTTGVITTVAGNGMAGYFGDGAAATDAKLNAPHGVRVDASGNLIIADSYNNVVRKVNAAGIISTIVGNGTPGYSGDGLAATLAEVSPYGVAIDAAGDIFIADLDNNVVRKVNASGTISTVAGTGTGGYTGDGAAATAAEVYNPTAVAIDASGNIFISDQFNNSTRKVNSAGIISTIAGNGTSGYMGDGSPATAAELDFPTGIAFDGFGNLFISDMLNAVIRKITALPTAAFSIPSSVVCQDSCIMFINTGTGSYDSIRWSISGVGVASPHSDTVQVCFPTAGSYTANLYVHNVSGSDTATMSFTIHPSPNPSIIATGHLLSVSGAYLSYQWYNGSAAIAGATGSSYTYTDTGTYTVAVDSGGCMGKSPVPITTERTASVTGMYANIALTPNPNRGVFTITGSLNAANDKPVSCAVVNMLGQVVYEQDIAVQKGAINTQIMLNKNLSSGMYLLHLRTEKESETVLFAIEN